MINTSWHDAKEKPLAPDDSYYAVDLVMEFTDGTEHEGEYIYNEDGFFVYGARCDSVIKRWRYNIRSDK